MTSGGGSVDAGAGDAADVAEAGDDADAAAGLAGAAPTGDDPNAIGPLNEAILAGADPDVGGPSVEGGARLTEEQVESAAAGEIEPGSGEADAAGAGAELRPVTEATADTSVAEPPAAPRDAAEPPPAPPGEPDAADPTPAPQATVTVGRLIADALRGAGVRYAFTVPGESFLGLLDGLSEAGIRVVATRHEGAAAFMAEAYGQLTGRPAACLATRAVGAANLSIGIHTARQNSTPMFALIGQVERRFRGRESFQEVDQVGSFGRVATWAAEPSSPQEAARAVGEGIRRAMGGRPGPVLLSLPEDLLDEPVPPGVTVDGTRPPLPRAETPEIRAVLQLLASAERPVILAGGGVLRARTSSDLMRLAELLQVPVVAAWRRADVVSNDHPLYLGMAGYGAPSTVRERLERADAMLVIGCRLNEITTFGYTIPRKGVRWAHVDLKPRVPANGLRPPDIAVQSDARAFTRGAVQRLMAGVLNAPLVDRRAEHNRADRATWEAASTVDGGDWAGPGVHPGRVVATLRRVLPDDAIIATDAGNFGGWTARGFRFRRPGTFLGPTSGAMGYGVPAAIAAALVHRDRPVVALTGDGGFAMSMAELETAVRERVRIVVLVWDNERYGTIRMHQDVRSAEPLGTDLGPIDFAAIARACGARGVRVETDEAFEPALRQALAGDRPTVVHLALDRAWVSVDRPAVPNG